MTAPAESVPAGAGSTPSSANTLPPLLDHIPRPLRKRNPFPRRATMTRVSFRVTVIGGGMITHDQILPSLYQLQRLGAISSIAVCAQRGCPLPAWAA